MKYCMDNDDILPTKASKYNSVVYMDQCAVCKVKNPKRKGWGNDFRYTSY